MEPFRSELAEEGRRFGVTCVGTDGTAGFHLELAASFASRRLKYKEAFDPEAKAKKLFSICVQGAKLIFLSCQTNLTLAVSGVGVGNCC